MQSWIDPLTLSYIINGILLLLVISVPLLNITALLQLRRHYTQEVNLALWVIVILFVPVLGAIAYFVTNHRQSRGTAISNSIEPYGRRDGKP